ncbi:Smr/MutS family protein [Limobrevibacterium gyesilva]|uniref:Smr/MutS family protein n=1 Tax=Limobrevibacterium gyesilva TaxID=2991712 RepID=A0AA42CG97_9PROT|nr:Smr/MutS family protein [Limobrevibacterium gyesilva]MCW3473615.1 Smr/MutS family protein [Limobrevibacterium gyesilva]
MIPQRRDVSAPRRKSLTDADKADWASYVRRVAPLPGRTVPDAPPEPQPEPPPEALIRPAPPPAAPRVPAPRAPTLSVGLQPGGLDSASWSRFRTGKLAPQRTLDLHGRTAQRAFHALNAFLHAAHADHVRCVEVITGRGSGEGGGILRRELPIWLNLPALRPLVLAASHPHAANTGSVRLLLRRPK